MGVLGERARGLGADALGGRIRRAKLGMLALDRLELAKELVVLEIGECGAVEDVVVVRRLMQQGAQLARALLRRNGGHAFGAQPLASSSRTCIATVTSRSSSSSAAFGRSVSAQLCSSPRA